MTTTEEKRKRPSASEAVVYTQLTLPFSVPADAAHIKALRESIALQTEGEAVEVSEAYPTPLLMIAFDVAHQTSPEMILRLNSGERILLFDHRGVPALRDEDIYLINETAEHKESEQFIPELTINLEAVWKKTGAAEDNPAVIESASAEVEKLTRPAMTTTLVGEAPALLFLLAQHSLYGKTGEIWYQEKATSVPVRVK